MKQQKGITLVALVITIIVLLILAGASIATITGYDSIPDNAKIAVDASKQDATVEQNMVNAIDALFKEYVNIVDWEKAKAEAVAPESQDEERNNGVIGIGTDGTPVDMDLWEYSLDNTTGGYGLNDATSLATEASANASAGYLGQDFTNINIPQYISIDNGTTWTAVTNLDWTFFNCTQLSKISRLPDTVKSMRHTFRGCISLADMINLPENLENMTCTFFGCSMLEEVPKLPKDVTNMYATFRGCSTLKRMSEIPNSVTNMYATFKDCSSLEKGPSTIPSSVNFLHNTFRNCPKLAGTIEIKANINGNKFVLEEIERLDYEYCFRDSVTEGQELTLKCTETIYNLFDAELQKTITTGNDNKLCSPNSKIKLEKIEN